MKKTLLIIGIVVILGIAALFIFGSQTTTPTGESRVGFSIRDYLPFGKSEEPTVATTPTTTTETSTTGEEPTIDINKPVPRLRKLSDQPVAGAIIFNTGATSTVRFVEKGSGNVYEAKSDSNVIKRISNTVIPKIVRAFWLPNGSGFLAQNILSENEIIETSFVKLSQNKASSTDETLIPFETSISKLPTGIKEIAIKPDSTKIFYYTISGSSNWFTSDPDGTKAVSIMSNPLTEWLPKWISGNIVIMQTKGSSNSVGFAYALDVANKTIKETGAGVMGISMISNGDNSLSIVSQGGANPRLFLINNKTASSTKISINTLADKCLWLKDKTPSAYCAVSNQIPNGNYPDIWYKGLISTEDTIKRIDMSNDISFDIADLSQLSRQQIDVIDMFISPDESHLIFRNKIDGYLWMLRIED
jgi:hypothetical protein